MQLNARGQLIGKYEDTNTKQIKFNKQIAITFGSNPISTRFIANPDFHQLIRIADPKLKI